MRGGGLTMRSKGSAPRRHGTARLAQEERVGLALLKLAGRPMSRAAMRSTTRSAFVDAVAPVRVIGTGWVASAGALIFLAGAKEWRLCLLNTRFLLHQPMGGLRGRTISRSAPVPRHHRETQFGASSQARRVTEPQNPLAVRHPSPLIKLAVSISSIRLSNRLHLETLTRCRNRFRNGVRPPAWPKRAASQDRSRRGGNVAER